MNLDPYAPIPGSPVDLERVARQLADSAARLEAGTERAARVHASLVREGWQGSAAERFEEAGSALLGRQRMAAGALSTVAEALLAFATTLESCQAELHRATATGAAPGEVLAREAWSRYEVARERLADSFATGQEQLGGARQPARTASITTLAPPPPVGGTAGVSALVEFVQAATRHRRHHLGLGSTGLAPAAVLLTLDQEAGGWELGPSPRLRWGRRRRELGRLVDAASGRVPRSVAGTLRAGPFPDPEAGAPPSS